ncbi:MAG: hypothetical protein GXP25_01950 [Planctomycetes bacterium]|nr:hypothetical protein [Planctomycetota bacterium]
MCRIASDRGEYDRAKELYGKGLAICEELGEWLGRGGYYVCMGSMARDRGEYHRAMELYEQGEQIFRGLGARDRLAECLRFEAYLHANHIRGNRDLARKRAEEALAISLELEAFYDVRFLHVLLWQIRWGITRRLGLLLGALLAALLATLGVGLGLYSPWLWLIGAPIVAASLFILMSMLTLLFLPRARLAFHAWARQYSQNTGPGESTEN